MRNSRTSDSWTVLARSPKKLPAETIQLRRRPKGGLYPGPLARGGIAPSNKAAALPALRRGGVLAG